MLETKNTSQNVFFIGKPSLTMLELSARSCPLQFFLPEQNLFTSCKRRFRYFPYNRILIENLEIAGWVVHGAENGGLTDLLCRQTRESCRSFASLRIREESARRDSFAACFLD